MYSRTLFALLALAPAAFAQTIDANLVTSLRTAATNEERIALLTDDQFVFNFLAGVGLTKGAAGTNTMANAGNFPALIANGVAMTIGFLEPCGMNTPHVHPRATEINFAVNGTLRTGMLNENGARFVANDVPAGSATVFPRGTIHFEMNTECHSTMFVAAFNDEDPGATAVAQRFFGLPPDIISASLGDIGVVQVAQLESKIPNNIAFGTDDCLARCGITRTPQNTTQRQPRLPDNALPSGFSGPPPPASAAPPPMKTSSLKNSNNMSTPQHSNLDDTPASNLNVDNLVPTSILNDKNVRPIFIALLTINSVFVVGVLTALFIYVARKRGGSRTARKADHARLMEYPPADKDHEYYDPYPGPTPAQ